MNANVRFAWAGSLVSIIFFVIVNQLTSPNHIWSIYPSFGLLFWPITVHFVKKKSLGIHALICSMLIICMLIIINYLYSPEHPWFLYASYPILWWPILIFAGKNRDRLFVAICGSLTTIVYYSGLNIVLAHEHPWAIYPTFAVLWWPLAVLFVRTRKYFQLSIWGSALIVSFFIIVNWVTSDEVWAIYPTFAVLWWPLSMYFFYYRRKFYGSFNG